MILQLLGGRTPAQFLARYWQKRPLLIRNAMPGFNGLATPAALQRLARREDVESRLVLRKGRRWLLENGPFTAARLALLPDANWTLLVQGLNLHLDSADQLLRSFKFVPYTRLDDVMVSYARPGGGVGPHLDSYDVFLLQGTGRRLWRIGRRSEPAPGDLVPGSALKILREFDPEEEYLVEPGDMLYLPPGWAHDGIALDDNCTTYSIGFRVPARREMLSEFLSRYSEQLEAEGHYADPGLKMPRHPSAVPPDMTDAVLKWLEKIRFTRDDVAGFLGTWLSEPKPRIVFDRPSRPLSWAAFRTQCGARGARLDLRTLMLTSGGRAVRFHINGEVCVAPAAVTNQLLKLADHRVLPAGRHGDELCRQLYDWYMDGWLHVGASA
jgi:50S ribosomal protein L16 3-hydroxylase